MIDTQKRSDQLQERLIDFAVRVIKLSSRLPKNQASRHVAGQILRSGTSPAPNYGEARAASSHADFPHHLSIVLSELNETLIWLHIMRKSELLKAEMLSDLINENQQLCKIFAALIKTARAGHSAKLSKGQWMDWEQMENGKWETENGKFFHGILALPAD